MELNSEDLGGLRVIRVRDARIDAAVAIQFKDRMRALTEGAGGRVLLDLSQVEFLDSSGLGAVVAAMKQLGGDRRLELAGLAPAVQKVFSLTRMDSVFRIHPDADTAMGRVADAS